MMEDLPIPGQVVGWLVIYGSHRQFRCLLLDRARAEQFAVAAHGVCMPVGVLS